MWLLMPFINLLTYLIYSIKTYTKEDVSPTKTTSYSTKRWKIHITILDFIAKKKKKTVQCSAMKWTCI